MGAERGRGAKRAKGGKTAAKKSKGAGKARGRAGVRKERVLHTRISEKLAEDIYSVAEDLRVPVSNLVRNVLEDTFSMVESVTDNVGDLIENVLDEAERARDRISRGVERSRRAARAATDPDQGPEAAEDGEDRERPEFPDIVGWQPLVLNHAQVCGDCGADVARGKRAVVGLSAVGLSATYLCLRCLNARGQ